MYRGSLAESEENNIVHADLLGIDLGSNDHVGHDGLVGLAGAAVCFRTGSCSREDQPGRGGNGAPLRRPHGGQGQSSAAIELQP